MPFFTKITLVVALMLVQVQALAKTLTFGEEVDSDKLIKISTVMANPDNYLSSPITIEGTIVGVCEKRGCWMTLASDKRFQNLRIKVEDGYMVFPMTAKGNKALATGTLEKIELSLDQTKRLLAHRAQKAGKEFNPDSVTEAHVVYQLSPTGVEIIDNNVEK
ncbi:DUF4920 domain-containing protein [Pseudoalteromonas spongiae]|uniref:DUF4920 domain-containing protein n=1 Tax=Pseudoalteromonas spongiae TaxID=298657 RepID=UPI0037367EBD